MSHPKPTAVLIEPKAHRRLSLVNALRDDLDLSPMSAFDTALRHIRMTRPDVVLIGLGWRTNPGLRLARQIKTDAGNNARVLLIDWPGRRPDPLASGRHHSPETQHRTGPLSRTRSARLRSPSANAAVVRVRDVEPTRRLLARPDRVRLVSIGFSSP